MKRLFSSITFIFATNLLIAQSSLITGKVVDASNNSPLKGAELVLKNIPDTMIVTGTVSDPHGQFYFSTIGRGKYNLRITFLGFKPYAMKVIADKQIVDLGTIKLQIATTYIKDITIKSKQIRAEQIGDTTQYNADAFKSKPDATGEEIVVKMPGITIDKGTVKSQNENIQQVTVDGKPFFGEDPSLALKSLPAEIIEKIQVFDKLSDQSQFTGFDDGQTVKTMNIVTRNGKNNGQFGKVYAGYGTDDTYLAGGYVNYFKNDRRISLIGMSNDINVQNFSSQDLLGVSGSSGRQGRGFPGGMPRGDRGGEPPGGSGSNFLVDQLGGISKTNSVGINYSDNLGAKIKVTGSYFYNQTNNSKTTTITRNYFNLDSLNDENDFTHSENYNHRLNLRFEYNIDSANSIIWTPKLYLQFNNSNSEVVGEYLKSTIEDASYNSDYTSDNSGYSLNNNLLFRHKFHKKGRTISLNLGYDLNNKTGSGFLDYLNASEYPLIYSIVSNQKIKSYSNVYTLSSNVSYTEPLGNNSQLQASYSPSYTESDIYQRLFNKSNATSEYDIMDTSLTNDFNSSYINNKGGLSYRYRKNKLNFSLGANYQYAELIDDQTFPVNNRLNRFYNNLLPNANMSYKFSQSSNLRLNYRASINIPSVSQLQNAIDNSNPTMLTSGNPDLTQQYTHTLFGNYSYTNLTKGQTFFVFFNAGYTENYISNSVYHATKDTVLGNNSITLYRGGQYTKLVNLPESWNARAFVTYGIPVDFLKCNLNFHTGFQYSEIPSLVNEIKNIANSYNTSEGIVLSSNINENVDFTLLFTANYNIVKNSLQPENNNNYYSHTITFKLNWIIYKGIFIGGDASNYLYNGLTKAYNQNYFLVNPYIGKKLFDHQNGEIRISAYDLLKENKSISRTVTESYIEDSNTSLLQRYFFVTFTYNIKRYKQDDKNYQRH